MTNITTKEDRVMGSTSTIVNTGLPTGAKIEIVRFESGMKVIDMHNGIHTIAFDFENKVIYIGEVQIDIDDLGVQAREALSAVMDTIVTVFVGN